MVKKHQHGHTVSLQKNSEPDICLGEKNIRYSLLWLLAIGCMGAFLVLFCTHKYGVGLSGDSIGYVASARSVLSGKGFLTIDARVLTAWPPLYPIVIAGLKIFKISESLVLRLINAVLFGMVIFLSGKWVLKQSNSFFYAILASACILLSKPLFHVSRWAWSELLFVFCVILFLYFLPYVLEHPTLKRVFLLSVITSAVCMTRYIGVVVFPIGAIAFIFNKKQTWLKRISLMSLWGICALIPLLLWLLRNWLLTNSITIVRSPNNIPIRENIAFFGDIICRWFFPESFAGLIPGMIIGNIFLILIVFLFYKNQRAKQINYHSSVLVSFVLVYSLVILYVTAKVKMDDIGDRFLCPLYIPIVLLFWFYIAKLLPVGSNTVQIKKDKWRNAMSLYFIIGICFGVLFSTSSNYIIRMIQISLKDGSGGPSGPHWEKSEVVRFVRKKLAGSTLYSNEPHAIYYWSNYYIKMLPFRLDYYKESCTTELRTRIEKHLADFQKSLVANQPVYLVWIRRYWRQQLYTPDQLTQICQVRLVKELKDGYIFALYPKL